MNYTELGCNCSLGVMTCYCTSRFGHIHI